MSIMGDTFDGEINGHNPPPAYVARGLPSWIRCTILGVLVIVLCLLTAALMPRSSSRPSPRPAITAAP